MVFLGKEGSDQESIFAHVGKSLRYSDIIGRVGNMAPRPDLNGARLKLPNQPAIYLIDRGQKRWIPNPFTFERLFRDWSFDDFDVTTIDSGPPISNGALLAKDPGTDPVWLVDHDYRQKRWITSPAVMDAYNFSWDRIETVSNYVLDAIPDGPPIT